MNKKPTITAEESMVNLIYLLGLVPNFAHGKFTSVGKENNMPTTYEYVQRYKCYAMNEDGRYGGELIQFNMLATKEGLDSIADGNPKVYITKVLYNNPATIVFWSDGTQTRNVCPKNTLYNPDSGLAFCVLKKFMGGNEMAKLFNDWELEDYRKDKDHYIELKDVRKKHKEEGK